MKKKLLASLLTGVLIVGALPVGASAEWRQTSTGQWWYAEGDSWASGWRYIGGGWYHFDANGIMQTGWVKAEDSKWYYMNSDGLMKTGWLQDATGKQYFLSSSGAMQTGVIEVEGKEYALDTSGAMLIGNNVICESNPYTTDANGVIINGNNSTSGARKFTKEGVPINSTKDSNSDTNTIVTSSSSSHHHNSSSTSTTSSAVTVVTTPAAVTVPVATTPVAKIEQAGTAIIGKTVVVASLPTDVDATLYTVTVKGTTLTYNATTKKFTGTLDGTYTIADLQPDTVVEAKGVKTGSADAGSVDLSSITVDSNSVPYSTIVTFKLDSSVADPENCTVTVKGNIQAIFNATTGSFAATVNGTLSTSDFKQTDFSVKRK